MPDLNLGSLQVGDEIPSLATDPVRCVTLALFAGASGDHNPIHVDIDFVCESQDGRWFAHSMLSMTYVEPMLTNTFARVAALGCIHAGQQHNPMLLFKTLLSILSIKCRNWFYWADRAERADRAESKEFPLFTVIWAYVA